MNKADLWRKTVTDWTSQENKFSHHFYTAQSHSSLHMLQEHEAHVTLNIDLMQC